MARKGEVTVLHVHEGNRQDFHLQQISLSTHAKYFFYKFFVISSSLKKCIVLESISVHQLKKNKEKLQQNFAADPWNILKSLSNTVISYINYKWYLLASDELFEFR